MILGATDGKDTRRTHTHEGRVRSRRIGGGSNDE